MSNAVRSHTFIREWFPCAAPALGAVWSLAGLYGEAGDEDPQVAEDLALAWRMARTLLLDAKRHLKTRRELDPVVVQAFLKDYEAVHEVGLKALLFAFLDHAGDTRDGRKAALHRSAVDRWAAVCHVLVLFEKELESLSEEVLQGLSRRVELFPYRRFLSGLIRRKRASSQPLEESGPEPRYGEKAKAFRALYDDLMDNMRIPVNTAQGLRQLGVGQALAVSVSRDARVREGVFSNCVRELERYGVVFQHVLNAVIEDTRQEAASEGHDSSLDQAHCRNGLEGVVFEEMVGAVRSRTDLLEKFIQTKSRMLEKPDMGYTDVYASPGDTGCSVTYTEARDHLLSALNEVAPRLSDLAEEFFDRRRIDAEPRPGKRGGAFCKCFSPSHAPYISMEYMGGVGDYLTLAHELGHGIHYRLASGRNHLRFEPPFVLAETASMFVELLAARHLREKFRGTGREALVLEREIRGMVVCVFRQSAYIAFERDMHAMRNSHALSMKEICDAWRTRNEELYGKGVGLPSGFEWSWCLVPHFVHRPFSCYSYIFGTLVAVVLLNSRRENQQGQLAERLIALLSAGSSLETGELLREIGLNVRKEGFWQNALDRLDRRIEDFARVVG